MTVRELKEILDSMPEEAEVEMQETLVGYSENAVTSVVLKDKHTVTGAKYQAIVISDV